YKKDGSIIGTVNYKDGIVQRGSFTDSRDGKKYATVKIGQTWMAENLNYDAEGSKCNENNPANCQTYGRLYDWNTALKACPSGWHLPNDDEWLKLVDIVGGGETAGAILKAASGWEDNGNGTDEFGFSALPGGYGGSDGSFGNVGYYGRWWSSTEDSADGAYGRSMDDDVSRVGSNYNNKSKLYSVRCLQD
ncbi:MAG: fibrobacter succinogenes major paralogous domain-containing protein, partial [Candidatus Fibromonas sp.]|nr:fibrobacter succinogenes major paralogous domain-containing protein [Candidatus Fibromonas sp.]